MLCFHQPWENLENVFEKEIPHRKHVEFEEGSGISFYFWKNDQTG